MLYEMLTGSAPFGGTTPLAVLTAHLTSPPVPPRERAPDRGISPALEAVTLHALAKDPAERYGTAAALAAAILHARAEPTDLDSVRPDAFRVQVDRDVDAHSPTHPALPSAPPSPPRARPAATPPLAPPSGNVELGARTWTIVWILAAVASIALGVWLSLHAPP
jgi:serine/threonine-protein kinase